MGRPGTQDARDAGSPLDAAPARSRVPFVVGSVGAAFVHALLLAAAVAASAMPQRSQPARLPQVTETLIHVEAPPPPEEPPPPPAPEPETPPPPPVVKRPPAPKPPPPPRVEKVQAPEEPAPAAAEAAQVIEKAPEPEVVDFGNTFVQGQAANYAGGVTAAAGTAKTPVRDPNARAYGVPGGTGQAAVDRSREPSLAEGTRWDCPFPEEADDEGIDEAVVTLRVSISAGGAVESVDVTQDPGSGFGREARRCAQRKRWQAGLDRSGNPIAATRTLRVRFER